MTEPKHDDDADDGVLREALGGLWAAIWRATAPQPPQPKPSADPPSNEDHDAP